MISPAPADGLAPLPTTTTKTRTRRGDGLLVLFDSLAYILPVLAGRLAERFADRRRQSVDE